jgi:hypothetical protein
MSEGGVFKRKAGKYCAILGVVGSSRCKERMCPSRVSPETVTPSSPSSLAPASPPRVNET